MDNSVEVTKCPKCGSTDLGKGKHTGYSVMAPIKKKLSFGSEIEYLLCTDCGFIIESYVKKPGKFKGTL